MQFNNNKNSEGAIFRPQSKKLLDQVAEVMRYITTVNVLKRHIFAGLNSLFCLIISDIQLKWVNLR